VNSRSVSVIICTQNRADILLDTIKLLREQDYPDASFEIIVVDNASCDQTPQVVQELAAKPGVPVRYVAEDRRGITFARNRGAEEAQYSYLAYLDDDCSVEPDWLSRLISGFDLEGNVVAVGGKVILDWSYVDRPIWLGSGLELWLGANGHLASQPCLLDGKTQVMESNMAIKKNAWEKAGGFLGMELFGSRHMASGEILYLLEKLRENDGEIAFVPQASVIHRMGTYTRQRFLARGYWQGVSAGVLDYLLNEHSRFVSVRNIVRDTVAAIVLLGMTILFYLKLDQANGMYHLVRATRRFSLVLTEMRIVGDWSYIYSWVGAQKQYD